MNMQHNGFLGAPIGMGSGERLEDRLKRIRADQMHFAARRARCDSPWFVLRVGTGYEQAVEKVLVEQGVEACVPMRMGPVRRRRHKLIPAQPMPVMMGYVLVRFRPSNEAFNALLGVEKVEEIIGGYEYPHRLSDEIVSSFLQRARRGEFDFEKPASLFQPGVRVRIVEGPFSNFEGKIVSASGKGRGDAVVELTLFGRATAMLVPLAMLAVS